MNLSSKTFLRAGLAAMLAASALSARAAVNPGNLPLWFEAGRGQADATTRFIAHGHDAEFTITPAGAEFTLRQAGGQQAAMSMTFVGAGLGSRLAGDNELGGKINYLLGNDPAQWRSGVPTYGKIRLDQVYPGVNVVYYGNQQKLEYDLDLAAGVNPETIAIRFDGAEKISVDPAGELVIQLAGGQVVQYVPVAYQVTAAGQRAVPAAYKIVDAHTVTFAVGSFDHALPLVIDPVLGYSAFFGGNSGETAWAMAINPVDNTLYIAGQTFSTAVSNGPPVIRFGETNSYATNFAGGTQTGDGFIAKFDSTGTNLVYCTYLGGSDEDIIKGIATDNAGHVFVTGVTESTNFPVMNAVQSGSFNGSHITGVFDKAAGIFPYDAFVAEITSDGAHLVYSTYLGGNAYDAAFGIACDPATGNAFVTGYTSSTNFPFAGNWYQNHLSCSNNIYANQNAFIAEIPEGGNTLSYSTYFGSTNFDQGQAIAFKNNRVFVAGYTASTNFPWANGLAACTNLNGFTNATPGFDAFVAMFAITNGTALSLQYSTFLGSSNDDVATAITADSNGNAYVVGWTTSTNFPDSTTNGLQLSSVVRTNQSGFVIATNAFFTKIAWNGAKASVAYSQIFGGLGVDVANGVTLDANNNIFIIGSASSTNFPVTTANNFGSLRSTNFSTFGLSDVFVTAITADLSTLLYSTYIGGSSDDFGYGIAVDTNGNAWITGQTFSTNYQVFDATWTSNAVHTARDGTNDAFLTKIVTATSPVLYASRYITNSVSDMVTNGVTNVLVYWAAVSDVTPATLGIESATNLLMRNVFTNGFTIKTNVNKTTTTNYTLGTNAIFTTNWVVETGHTPVLINSNYSYIFGPGYLFNPTNTMRFYRFHHY